MAIGRTSVLAAQELRQSLESDLAHVEVTSCPDPLLRCSSAHAGGSTRFAPHPCQALVDLPWTSLGPL